MIPMITGFEPLDIIIMESDKQADKLIAAIQDLPAEYIDEHFDDILLDLGIDLEDLTGNDMMRIDAALEEKGFLINA